MSRADAGLRRWGIFRACAGRPVRARSLRHSAGRFSNLPSCSDCSGREHAGDPGVEVPDSPPRRRGLGRVAEAHARALHLAGAGNSAHVCRRRRMLGPLHTTSRSNLRDPGTQDAAPRGRSCWRGQQDSTPAFSAPVDCSPGSPQAGIFAVAISVIGAKGHPIPVIPGPVVFGSRPPAWSLVVRNNVNSGCRWRESICNYLRFVPFEIDLPRPGSNAPE